jgi:hypothetical protein
LNPKTFPQETCPESFLQLLSLRSESDGFIILKNFMYLRSSQLEGKYRDFRRAVKNLIVYDKEHLNVLLLLVKLLHIGGKFVNIDVILLILLQIFPGLLRMSYVL